jgi:hypothetical protein
LAWNDPAHQTLKQELLVRLAEKRMRAEPAFVPRHAFA